MVSQKILSHEFAQIKILSVPLQSELVNQGGNIL